MHSRLRAHCRTGIAAGLRCIVMTCCAALAGSAIGADAIDLDCEAMAGQLVGQLAEQQLLAARAGAGERSRALMLESCVQLQRAAQTQHESGKRAAIANWLFESTGGKPGNKRLRDLKR